MVLYNDGQQTSFPHHLPILDTILLSLSLSLPSTHLHSFLFLFVVVCLQYNAIFCFLFFSFLFFSFLFFSFLHKQVENLFLIQNDVYFSSSFFSYRFYFSLNSCSTHPEEEEEVRDKTIPRQGPVEATLDR